jgi:hypothetical protein
MARAFKALVQPATAWPSTRRPGALRALAGLPFSFARARARLSSMSRMASQISLTTASSLGKWPRFLMILRIW